MVTSFVMNLRCKAYEFIIKETVPSDRNLGIRFPESWYHLKRNSGTVAPERRFRIARNTHLLSLYFDKPLILINSHLDKQTKQMVCGYALGHYLEHQLLMDLHTLNKFLTIKDKHILLYEHNAFTSHLMLDSDEVYQMTKRGLDAAQISAAKRIHLNLVLVKLLELHHLGYDLRHYHAQHHAFIKQFNLPAHFQFDVAAG